MATVVCALWLDAFPASYVHVLKNAVAASLKREHRFICITDNPEYIGPGIETAELPDMGLDLAQQRHGCWPKLSIFKPGVLPPDEPTLYLDLDVMVRKDLDAFFTQIEENRQTFNTLRNGTRRYGNSCRYQCARTGVCRVRSWAFIPASSSTFSMSS